MQLTRSRHEVHGGEDNHLATAMDPWSKGGLHMHHSGGRHGDEEGLRWWFPSPAGCWEELLDPPNLGSTTAAAYSMFRGWMFPGLGFLLWREIIGGRVMSEGGRGAHTTWWRSQGVARTTLWCGRLLALLCLSFGLHLHVRQIGTLAFISSNSENISCVTFLKYKNSRKQELALWHLVNRLVPKNA
jgi:hypothetical protein